LAKPKSGDRPANGRKLEPELTLFEVGGNLTMFKAEPDRDLHLVIADLNSPQQTMVAEILNTECKLACQSLARTKIRDARTEFLEQCGAPAKKFKTVNPPIQVTVKGIGFFDKSSHGNGAASNGIELHPVIEISFSLSNGECSNRAQ